MKTVIPIVTLGMSLLLVGCAGPEKSGHNGPGDNMSAANGSAAAHATAQRPIIPPPPDNRPIEVRKQTAPDGTLLGQEEGYIDENGEFVRHGALINFWEDGAKKSELFFVHGVRQGPRRAWYKNGRLWNEGQYVDGRAEGTWIEWLPNGIKGREMHFEHGGLNGWMTMWYPNGKMRQKVMYLKGLRQGRETYWDRDGSVMRELDYVDDVPQP